MNLDGTPDDEDIEFYDRYGPWDAVDPVGPQTLMEGFSKPWWVVGGHAMEAFTGVPRPHEDIDLVIFSRDVPSMRAHFEGRFHLWSNDRGTLRPLNDRFPEPLTELSQVWVRENARTPWIIDCPLNPDVDGRWQSKRDASHVADLEDVTWVDQRGIRFLNPEIVLLFKAMQNRPKDRHDPDHPWNERLADA